MKTFSSPCFGIRQGNLDHKRVWQITGSQPGCSRITKEHLKIIKARVPPRLNWHLWEWGQASVILNTPLMNSNTQPSWRTTGLDLTQQTPPHACLSYWIGSKTSLIWHQNIWCVDVPGRSEHNGIHKRNPFHHSPNSLHSLFEFTLAFLQLESFWVLTPSVQYSSVAQLCPTLCNPMDCSTPDFPINHHLQELAQTQVHRVSDAIQPSHPLSFPSPFAFNLSQHQGRF